MDNQILVETSARHVHLTDEHIEILFGKGHTLTHKKDLSPARSVRVRRARDSRRPEEADPECHHSRSGASGDTGRGPASPTRERSALTLPVASGDIKGSAGCKIVGPEGEIEISEGVIVAKRHIHLTPADAEKFGVEDKQIVSVKITNDSRSTIFGDVVCRVSPKFAPAMHIDTDEANASCAFGKVYGEIIK